MKYFTSIFIFLGFILSSFVFLSCSKNEEVKNVELSDSINTLYKILAYENKEFSVLQNTQNSKNITKFNNELFLNDKEQITSKIKNLNLNDIEEKDNINVKTRPSYFKKLIIYLDSNKYNKLQSAGGIVFILNDNELNSIISDLKIAENNFFLAKDISKIIDEWIRKLCDDEDISDNQDIVNDLKIKQTDQRELIDFLNRLIKEKGSNKLISRSYKFSSVGDCKSMVIKKIIN
jgi:hypothetical protein